MRISVFIQLRGTLTDVIGRLPETLEFLAPELKDLGRDLLSTVVAVEPSQLEELLRFGRQRIGGKTILRVAQLYERYDRTELGDSPMAELYNDTGWDYPAVENMLVAFRGRWECGWCDRVGLEQVGPLKVRPAPSLDVQITDSRHMLVVRRLAPLVEQHGAEVRGLSGPSEFVQVVTPDVVTLRPEFPLFRVYKTCPGCGRDGYDRSDKVEGSLLADQADEELIVRKEWPLWAEVTDIPASRSRDLINWRGCEAGEGRHQVGEEFDLERIQSWESGKHAVFVGLTLVDAMLERGATGLSLRPVYSRGSPSAD